MRSNVDQKLSDLRCQEQCQRTKLSPKDINSAFVMQAKKSRETKRRQKPIKNPNQMDICFVSAEAAPWSKTGGLGDVVGSLPIALARRGHRVMVVVPR